MPPRAYCLRLSAILAVSLLARGWCYEPAIGDDDQRWIVSARELHAERSANLPAVYYGRILWRATLSAWGHVIGSSLESSAVLMFLLAGLSIVLTASAARAAFAREPWGDRAALLAAAVFGLHPICIYYDTMTLPDGLAVPVLVGAVLLVLRVLNLPDARSRSATIQLLMAGMLCGAAFCIKEYFVFLVLPLMWSVRRRGLSASAWLAVGCCLGVGIDFGLHAWDNGDPLGHFRSFAAFAGYETTESYSGLRKIAGQLARRIEIPQMLLATGAGIGGWLIIGSVASLLVRRHRSAGDHLVVSAALLFLVFLCIMPLKLRPLTLVHIQARYLLCLLPFLAIGASGFLATAWERVRATELRAAAMALLGITLIWNIPAADSMPQTYNRRELAAIRQCLAGDGLPPACDTLIVPFGLDPVAIPDRLMAMPVRLVAHKRLSLDAARRLVQDHPAAAVYVSDDLIQRTRFAVDPLLSDEMLAARGTTAPFCDWLQSIGYVPTPVEVPDGSLRRWAARVGIRSRGIAAGMLFTR